MKYTVKAINTFVEIFFVEAENEEEAQKVAMNSDYNASKWVGMQIYETSEYEESDYKRTKNLDDYVYPGFSKFDESGNITYEKHMPD
jgi:hypothetical protein